MLVRAPSFGGDDEVGAEISSLFVDLRTQTAPETHHDDKRRDSKCNTDQREREPASASQEISDDEFDVVHARPPYRFVMRVVDPRSTRSASK